jgi:hypothetical protein
MATIKPNAKKIDQLLQTIKSDVTDDILSACETLIVEDEFFQWEGQPQIRKQRELNKQYFLEAGGIKVMIDLIVNTKEDLIKRFGIDVLWAYSETDENRRELLFAGVLPVIIECLKVDNAKVQEGAVGALWQLLEYEPIQTQSIEAGLLDPLLNLLTASKVTRTQTRAAGCLHLITWNEITRESLIKMDAIPKILAVDTTALMVNYFRLLAIANIILLPHHREMVPEEFQSQANAQFMKFIQTETPEGVRSIEDRLMYIWISMRPYVPLVYSPVKEIYLLGMFALANLTGKADNRRLLIEEELSDKVLCLSWTNCPEAKVFADAISKNIITNSKPSEPPSLYSIVYNYLNNHHRIVAQQ